MILTSLSLTSCSVSKGEDALNYKSYNKTDQLLTTIINGSSSEVSKINPADIPVDNIYAANNKISFNIGDTAGATLTIKILNATTEEEIYKDNVTSNTNCVFENLSAGRWFVYCTKLGYADGTSNSSISMFNPYLLKDLVVSDDTSKLPPSTDSNGTIITNNAISVPILRYDPYKSLTSQKSEIKNITSSTVSLLSYEYSNIEISGIQYKLIDGTDIKESAVLSPGDIKAYTFSNLQPNKTYTVGYRVLNADKINTDGTQIKGVWSNYNTTIVTTNASKQLTVTQGLYTASTNSLILSVGARTNEVLPMYKLKILPSSIGINDVLSTEQDVSIETDSGINITNSLTKVQNLNIKNLKVGEMYTVYVTEVIGANGTLVKSNPVADKDSDAAVVAAVSIKISNNDADSNSIAQYIISNKFSTLPSDIQALDKDKIRDILNIVSTTDLNLAGNLYYKTFGVDSYASTNSDTDLSKYNNLGNNIYISKETPLRCVEYVDYKVPSITRVYGVE